MGFRFRKSIKLAPGIKLNFNKKSTGLTFGGKGFHYTVNNKGKRTASMGIPGTGLSYSATSGGEKPKKKYQKNDYLIESEGDTKVKNKSKKKGCLPAVIISLIIAGIIGSCATDSTDMASTTVLTTISEEVISEEVTTAPTTVAVIASAVAETTTLKPATTFTKTTTEIETTTEKQTTAKPTTTKQKTTTQKETTTEIKTTTQKATTTKKAETTKKVVTTQKPTTTKKVTTTKKATTKQKPTTTKKVTTTKKKVVTTKKASYIATDARYVLNTKSKKFHYPSCHSAAKISAENYAEFDGTRDEIMGRGYTPCGNCDP